MDFSYEFLMFQHGNHDTKERLEYYQNFIMTLLGELKTLRETICNSCQQKCAATRSGDRSLAISKDSTIVMRPTEPCNVDIPTSPRIQETDVLWRTPAPGYSSPPINEKIASDSSSLSPERRNESDNPIFYAERYASTNSTTDVTFVHSFRHKNHVCCVCFSRDGRYLAVGTGINDTDGSIPIYEVESRKKYCELREYASQYGSYTRPATRSLYFSNNGRYLGVLDTIGRIITWDVPNKRIRSILHWRGWLREVRFSPDGRLLACRTGARLVVLNMRDNSRRMASEGSCFDFNPGGRLIATGNDDVLVILDVRTGKVVKRWNAHGSSLYRVLFTSDGRGLLCAYNDMMEQWDVSDGEPVLIRKLDFQRIYRLAISSDHRLLTNLNQLWDVNTGKRQFTLKGHNAYLSSFDFSTAGSYLAMGSYDGFVSIWLLR